MTLDHMTSRAAADHGHQFADGVAAFFAAANHALKRLNQIEFEAPWKRDGHRRETC